MKRRKALAAALAAAGGAWLRPAFAEQYPERSIRLIVPATPGTAMDSFARMIATRFTAAWGQSIVIDNRRGAGQVLGVEVAARTRPDGYTLLMVSNAPFTINPVMGKVTYDPLHDFDPVGSFASNALVLVTRPDLPARTVAELIALAKQKPRGLNAGSSGNGSTGHLAITELNRLAGVEIAHVPYKGSPPSLNAAIAGEIDIVFADPAAALPLVKEGRLRMLATTGAKRLSFLPNVPTLAESGVPGFNVAAWFAFFAPHGTPHEVVRKVNAELVRQLQDPRLVKQMLDIGLEAFPSTPEELGELVKKDVPRWREIVTRAGLKAD